mgnify:FL=1
MSKINIVTTDELREMRGSEGLILQGCGGDLTEWLDGINEILTKESILLEETKFESAYAFKHDGLTNLLFTFGEDVKLNIGKLAMWRLASHETFGGTWLTDYVENRLGGFEKSAFEKEIQKLNTFTDTETSFEFQCDQTGGWPTCLMWNRTECKAWLAPNEHLDDNEQYYEKAMRACEEFGIRTCENTEEFNSILESLGEDAKNCKIYEESEEVELC